MFIWNGLGFLVPLALMATAAIYQVIVSEENMVNSLFFLIACPICLIVGFGIKWYRSRTCEHEILVMRNGKEKEVPVIYKINKSTGVTETIFVRDTFFFIPVEYWGIVCGVLCVVYFFAELLSN